MFDTIAANPRRRLIDCARSSRRARRIVATLVALDGTLFLVVTLAIMLLSVRPRNTLLLLFHATHLGTLLLGSVVVYHTAHAYNVLRWLMLAALISLIGDLCVAMFRIIIIMQTDDDDALQLRTQAACLFVACAYVLCVDIPLAYFADDLRNNTITPVGAARSSLTAQQSRQSGIV